ncbi:MAG: hypothetical protein AAFX85_07660 [Pseudomonadota bacterium]
MRRALFLLIIPLSWVMPALAQVATCNDFGHFDVFLDVVPRGDDTQRIAVRRDNPADPNFLFSLGYEDRTLLVPADFGDFGGGPHKTDDPGWVVESGDFLQDDVLWFRALGSLSFFDPARSAWLSQPPAGERVRFFGAIPPEVFLDGDPEELEFYRQGTIWSSEGLAGPTESAIEQASSDGSIHSHLDFCLEDSTGDCTLPGIGNTGNPAIGAYLIELQLFSDATTNGDEPRYLAADPVKVILNNGLVADECEAALRALSDREAHAEPQSPMPASGILVIGGG